MVLSPIGKNMALTLIRLQVLKLQQCIFVNVEFAEATIPKLAIMRQDELKRIFDELSGNALSHY